MKSKITLNLKERLYVIHGAGGGFSCLGFNVAHDEAQAVAEWLKRPELTPTAQKGTHAHYDQYTAALVAGRKHNEATGERCPAELTPQLSGKEGKYVEVVDRYNEKRRFYVGKSTGWMPCHIERARINSTGGPAVTGAPFKSIRVIR